MEAEAEAAADAAAADAAAADAAAADAAAAAVEVECLRLKEELQEERERRSAYASAKTPVNSMHGSTKRPLR